tara:strand:+ start:375 stop:674 length:300 start_codon:yes stop_codon:yes gene_type:complete
MSEQEHYAHYESVINKSLRTNFSKETAEDVSSVKDAEISALRFERKENLAELKRLIKHGENPKLSEDDQSPHYLSDGEMLDYILDKLKDLTKIKHRLNN